jgi:hypothetical protein
MGVFQGIALLIGGPGITYLPESFSRFGQAQFLGLQSPVWVLIVLAILAHYSMAHTRFFRQFYYLGSNPKAAHLSGMNVEVLQISSFVLMGLLAGLAGILYASRIATATSTVGVGAELQRHHRGYFGWSESERRPRNDLGSNDWGILHGFNEECFDHFPVLLGMAGNRTWRRLSCCRSHRRNREPETRLLNQGSVSVSASVSWGGATFVARSGHRRNRKRNVSACRRRAYRRSSVGLSGL